MPICQPSQGHKLCAPADIPSSLGPPPRLTQTLYGIEHSAVAIWPCVSECDFAHLEQAIKHVISKLKETKDHMLRRDLLGELGLQSADC
jgi:hypothetical protein